MKRVGAEPPEYLKKINDLFDEVRNLLKTMCTDTLGRGFIVYFPNIKYKD